jgi:hypothetical protein
MANLADKPRLTAVIDAYEARKKSLEFENIQNVVPTVALPNAGKEGGA